MADNTEILREIRDLLRLMAEPALAKRDERLRTSLQELIGKSKQKAAAVVLMDGTRSQADIRKDCGIDNGNLSRLVKVLREAELIGSDDKYPKLVFPVPANLPDAVGKDKE
jgi:DNA-binding MarR family transcriptional regulator